MKLTGFILLFSMAYTSLPAQYFLTGEVRDSHGDKLQNVSILCRSTGERYRTGVYGDFRIVSHSSDDSLSFSFNGYQSYITLVSASGFLQVTLRRLPFVGGSRNNHLISATSQPELPAITGRTVPDNLPPGRWVENTFVPQSATVSFRAGINRASYSYVRRFLDMGLTVPPEAVKIEEMLNYFNSYYEEPDKKCLFRCSSDLLSCPWNATHKLLFLNICARKVDIEKAPPSNLVFLIDASGSMDMPNKMPLVKSGFRSLIENLRDKDAVSLVQYGGRVGVRLEGISGSRKDEITRAIEEIQADGPTPGETGIRLAYQVAQRQFIPGGNNRIILITDGDINEGLSTENELEELIGQQGRAGIHLTCLGIGMDSTQNSRLADLAEKGQGNFAYVSEEEDMGQLLVKELAPAKFAVADNVCITTEFDSSLVKEYRLIGFDNRKNALEDTSFRLEGSTVGSGHSILALFEIVPKIDTIGIDTIARVKIHYCLPGQNAAEIMSYNCLNNPVLFDRAETSLKKAACIAIFGMKLKESGYAAQISWIDMEKMTKKTFTGNYFMDRQYIALVSKARKIYEHRSSH